MRTAIGLARILTLIVMLATPIFGLASPSANLLSPFRASVAQAQGLPDLQPVSLTVSPSGTMYIGQTYTATLTVRNAGAVPTAGNWVDELWLSTDPTFDGADRFVGNEMWSSGPVASGATYTLQVTFTLPSPPPGAWYLLLRADVNNWLAESNNANNLLAIPVNVDYAPPPAPDLVIDGINTPPGTLEIGSTVALGFTVRNGGTAGTPGNKVWSDGLFLSQDQAFNSKDLQLGGAAYTAGALAPSATYLLGWTVTVPDVSPGTWYLIASTDHLGELTETSDANNRRVQAVEIVPPAPAQPTETPTLVPTSTPTPVPPTATPVPTDTPTPNPTNTSTPVPTDTPTLVPTNTSTPVPTDTPTPVPTDTPTPPPTLTFTPVPTDTPTPVPTETPVPTNTPTPLPTDTPTPVKPTDTPTPVPTNTPTSVPTNTPPPIPTDTPLPTTTPTATPVPPTATATATPDSGVLAQRVTPVFECWEPVGDGRYRAHWGFSNPNDRVVAIAVGADNGFDPVPINRGQPVDFKPGRQRFVFSTESATGGDTWALNGSSVTAGQNGERCVSSQTTPTPTQTPTKTPVPPTSTKTPTATPIKTSTPATAGSRDGVMTGGGLLRDGDRTAALRVSLSCDDDRRPARLELLWRVPADRDAKDDRRPEWDWDDRQWDGRAWSTRDWKDRDWDDYDWDDRDWRNWGRHRSERRVSSRDSEERRGGWGRFHLTSTSSAQCTNDPSVAGGSGAGGFDTLRGTGRGRLADGSGATIEYTLVDSGRSLRRDRVTLRVRDDRGRVVFEISNTLTTGKLEADGR